MLELRRILTVQDISCVGKCSLTAALPVISALGVECAVLPTAVLSTHTGGFGKPAVTDMTAGLGSITAHWRSLGLTFDALLSGYLGSAAQADTVAEAAETLVRAGGEVIIDPVMADNGRLYSGFDGVFVEKMRGLCASASLILPNLTEAALLVGGEYRPDTDENYAFTLCEKLCSLGARRAVVTGVLRGEEIGAAALDSGTGERFACYAKRETRAFHGTGDIFAAVTAAALVRGRTLHEGVDAAVGYTAACIRASLALPEERRYGTAFETRLGTLTRMAESWDE